jgi:hypothetical protein
MPDMSQVDPVKTGLTARRSFHLEDQFPPLKYASGFVDFSEENSPILPTCADAHVLSELCIDAPRDLHLASIP